MFFDSFVLFFFRIRIENYQARLEREKKAREALNFEVNQEREAWERKKAIERRTGRMLVAAMERRWRVFHFPVQRFQHQSVESLDTVLRAKDRHAAESELERQRLLEAQMSELRAEQSTPSFYDCDKP